METSETVRTRRLIERGENSHSWLARWTAAEEFYFNTYQPHRAADLTIAGE